MANRTDEPSFERIAALISAVQAFLDTDAAYGSDDVRTREKKELLAQAMAALMLDDVALPQLRVIRGDLGGDDDA